MATKESPMTLVEDATRGTDIKLYHTTTPGFEDVEQCFVANSAKTLGVARPQTAEDVATLVRACLANGIEFTIRTGGHDCVGRTKADGALMIDMRDIKHVSISEDKSAARVGGGILIGDLATSLGHHGLATPVGTVASVGYVGWSTIGGYGPLSSSFGLGIDQIVGAKIVTSEGKVQEATEDMLVGIRGGGGNLGVIVELAIKVYPLKTFLSSVIAFESSDLQSVISKYTDYYEGLLETNELPTELQIQPVIMDMPGVGVVFALFGAWAGDDLEEGRSWFKKLASIHTCIMEATQELSLGEHLANNEKVVNDTTPNGPPEGRNYTWNLKKLTPKTIEIVAKAAQSAPGGGLIFSYHTMRNPRDRNEKSVFGCDVRHHMLEIYAIVANPSDRDARLDWARNLQKDIASQDPENVLESSYISIGSDGDTDLKKVYGRHYSTLLDLKKKYDPNNVFKYAVPRLIPIVSGTNGS